MSKTMHKLWLKVTAVAIFCYAILFFLGTITKTNKLIQLVLDLSSWPLDGNQNYDAPTTVFLSALLGGILLGWAVLIWLLSSEIYEKAPEQTRKIVLASLLSWFLVDSLGSILSGNFNNFIVNIFLLLILVGPLWRPARE